MPISEAIKKRIKLYIKDNHLNIKIQKDWKNFSGTVHASNALLLDIQDLASLVNLQQFIFRLNNEQSVEQKFSIRVAAGGKENSWHSDSFSLTTCARGNVIYRLVGGEFNQIGFDNEGDSERGVVRVGGSLQVYELDKALWDLNLHTTTSTLVPYVTVAGLLATASHGTGRHQPSYAGLVESITLLLENGKVITLDKSHPLFADIIGAHFGVFGIVLSVKLQCQPANKIKITRTPASFSEFTNKIELGLFDNNPYMHALYMPTPDGVEKGSKNVLLIKMEPVALDAEDSNRQSASNRNKQEREIRLAETFRVFDIVNAFSSIKPFFQRQVLSSQIGLEEKVSIGPWYDMHYQTAFPKKMSDVHWLLPVKSSADIHQIVTELQALLERNNFPFLFGILFRCFAGTNGGLSSSHHRDNEFILTVDIVSKLGEPTFEAFKQEWNVICRARGGKPHWGKELPADFDVQEYYGEQYGQFMKTYHLFYDEHGLDPENSMFVNKFAAQLLRCQPAMRQVVEPVGEGGVEDKKSYAKSTLFSPVASSSNQASSSRAANTR